MALQSKDFSIQRRSGGGGILYTYIVRVIENSVDKDKNVSNVTLKCILKQDYSGAAFIDWTMLVAAGLDSTMYIYDSQMRTSSGTAEQVYAEWTGDIKHDDDGTLTSTVIGFLSHNFNVEYLPVSPMSLPGTDTFTFTPIPRASAVTAYDATLGNACSIRWTPASAGFRYKLKFALGDWEYTTDLIHPNKTTEYVYSGYKLPLDVANQFDTRSSKMAVTLYTYSDSAGKVLVGSDAETFNVTVPDNSDTQPAVSMSLSPDNGSLGSAFSGLYIQGKSKVKGAISASGKYGATIKSYGMTVDGKDYDSAAPTSDYINKTGSVQVVGWAYDSRQYRGVATKVVEFLGYSAPQVQASCGRCNDAGDYADNGERLRIVATRIYSKLTSGGVQKNYCYIRYRYKREADSNYSPYATILERTASANTIDTGAITGVTLDKSATYLVQIQAVDDLGETSTPATFRISSEAVYMDKRRGGTGLGLGKRVEEDDLLDVAWKAIFRKLLKVEGDIYEAGNKLADKYQAKGNYAGANTNGSAALSAEKLQTKRGITIGDTRKEFDGSADLMWTLAEIGLPLRWKRTDVVFTNGVGSVACDGSKTDSMILAIRNTPASGNGTYTGIMTAGCAVNGTVSLGLDDNSDVTLPVTILWST